MEDTRISPIRMPSFISHKQLWQFTIITYIALGLVLSLPLGIVYYCEGPELFPTHYASPFIFKKKSLGSSMEYHFSLLSLGLNTLIWCIPLYLVDLGMKRLKQRKLRRTIYRILAGILIAFASWQIIIAITMVGRGFNENLNYWYWNMSHEAQLWGATCEGQVMIWGDEPIH